MHIHTHGPFFQRCRGVVSTRCRILPTATLFGHSLSMNSSARASGVAGINNRTLSGLVTSILELGAWVDVLANGIFADALGRKLCVLVTSVIFSVGVVVQAFTHDSMTTSSPVVSSHVSALVRTDPCQPYSLLTSSSTLPGSLSMIASLYNAELAPPEIPGSLEALQQLLIWLRPGYPLPDQRRLVMKSLKPLCGY